MTALAMAAAIGATLLLLRPSGRVHGGGGVPGVGRLAPARVVVVALLGGPAAVVLLGGVGARALVLLAIGAGTLAAGAALLRARARQRAAVATATQVLEACEAVAAELASGQPPGAVLERGAVEWPLLAPVAESFRVGADVPDAWRAAAARPGAGDLRLVGAAWQVAHRTGSGLAVTLDQVVADLRATRATRRVVDGELASARSTARLIAALPVLSLAMGSGAGGDPWGFLLGTPLGLGCLGLGLACGIAGLAWIEALARGVDH